jgi:hypothetical protein
MSAMYDAGVPAQCASSKGGAEQLIRNSNAGGMRKKTNKIRLCGRSSVVERQLPKLYVVGSIPIARSNINKDDRLTGGRT